MKVFDQILIKNQLFLIAEAAVTGARKAQSKKKANSRESNQVSSDTSILVEPLQRDRMALALTLSILLTY